MPLALLSLSGCVPSLKSTSMSGCSQRCSGKIDRNRNQFCRHAHVQYQYKTLFSASNLTLVFLVILSANFSGAVWLGPVGPGRGRSKQKNQSGCLGLRHVSYSTGKRLVDPELACVFFAILSANIRHSISTLVTKYDIELTTAIQQHGHGVAATSNFASQPHSRTPKKPLAHDDDQRPSDGP